MSDAADIILKVHSLQTAIVTRIPAKIEEIARDQETVAMQVRDALDQIDLAIETARETVETHTKELIYRISAAKQTADEVFGAMSTGLQSLRAAATEFGEQVSESLVAQQFQSKTTGEDIAELGRSLDTLLNSGETMLREWADEARRVAEEQLTPQAHDKVDQLDGLREVLARTREAASTGIEVFSRDAADICNHLDSMLQDGAGTIAAEASSRISGVLDTALGVGVAARLQEAQAIQAPCEAVQQAIGADLQKAASTLASVIEIIRVIRPVLDTAKAIL